MLNDLQKFGKVYENVSLKDYNTYKIGGIAKFIVFPSTIDMLIDLLKYIDKNNIKYKVIGNGSNIIFSEKIFDGIIIKLDSLNSIEIQNNIVTAESGVNLPKLVSTCINNNLANLEWAAGIPGTIGGSIVGNAGAYKCAIFDYLVKVVVLNDKRNIIEIKKDDIKYNYRYSEFKDKYKNFIILKTVLKLEYGNKEESLEILRRRRETRNLTQPLEYPSAGSVFRNPDGDFAGRLIEKLGLKGKKIGGAMVSEKHANFIINVGNASSNDVKDLIELIHKEVLEKDHIDLTIEQEFVNWE